MKRVYVLFVLIFGLVLGNYRELLNFVQQIKPYYNLKEIHPHEYHELIIPHSVVRRCMDKLYAAYMKRQAFNIIDFMDSIIEGSLGCLLPVLISSKSQGFEPWELEVFFNKSKKLNVEYSECLNLQLKERSPVDCIKQLFNVNLEGVGLEHANSAIYFLEGAKRLYPANKMPAVSTIFRMQDKKEYLEDFYRYLMDVFPRIANDRKTLLPEVVYVYTMFRYIYHSALFMGKIELSRKVFGSMQSLHKAGNLFTTSTLQTEYLLAPQAINVKDQVVPVDRIIALGVSQGQRLEKDIMRVFVVDGTMYVSFPHYYSNVVSSIIAKAKKLLQVTTLLCNNPMSFSIPTE